jgi:CBS domain-containing protein
VDSPATDDAIGRFLMRHAPYDRLRPEHLAFLVERLRPVRFADGEAVTDPEAGPVEWFYILMEGSILGEEQVEDGRNAGNACELVPGECFPIGALLARRPVHGVQRAVGDVVCLTMDRGAFDALRAASQPFADYCANRLAGLAEQVGAQVRADATRGLGDGSLNVTLAQKTLREPVTAAPETPVIEVLRQMSAARIGSMIVADGDRRPLGIFTLKDLMNRVALEGRGLDVPVRAVMTPDPITVPRSAFAFEAAMAMAHAGVRHLVVVEDGRVTGVVSEHDLFSMQRVGLANLSKAIARANDVAALARHVADIHRLVAQMVAQGVKVGQITQIITVLNDQIVRRVIGLAIAEAEAPPELSFTWVAFGSEGRQEQTLKTDQDNGILFAPPDGMADQDARAALLPLADRINRALDECGFPLCTGGIMARNPECCLSFREWRGRFARWIEQSTPEHLLNATIYFDFRPIWGPDQQPGELRRWLLARVAPNGLFQRHLAANALRNSPPLGVFRDFRLSGSGAEANTVDLKVNGVTPFIDAARIFALARGVAATNTVERLQAASATGAFDAADGAAWTEAYDYVRLLRIRLNEEQERTGATLSNRIDPERLNDLDRRILREAFREAKRIQTRLTLTYQL